MSGEAAEFHWLDYVLFTASLAFSLGVGIYHGFFHGGQKSTSRYLLGDKNLSILPVAMSLIMSQVSALSVLANPSEYYLYGTQAYMATFGAFAAGIISSLVFIPTVYPLGVTSLFEYHEKRFKSTLLRKLASIVSILYLVMYLGIVAYAPSTALEAVTGFPLWASILCTAGLGTIYTTVGGMKAVVWTDFFQGIIFYLGLLLIVILGAIEVGGLGEVFAINKEQGRLEFFDMNPDPAVRQSFWSVMISSFLLGLTASVGSQTTVQRYMSTKTTRSATITVILNYTLSVVVYTILLLVGLTIFAYYEFIGCDPYRGKLISNSNQLLPYFVVDVLNFPGFPGLFVAVLFCGALSSISSALSSVAALTWKDFLEPCFPKLTESSKAMANKIIVAIAGGSSLITATIIAYSEASLYTITLSVLGGFSAPLAGMFLLGAVFPCAQWKGATVGLITGVGMALWMNTGYYSSFAYGSYLETNVDNCTHLGNDTARMIPPDNEDVFWLYKVSFWYISPTAWISSIVVGLLCSLATGRQKSSDLDSRLMVPLPDRLCCCLSSHQVCDCCYCGVDYYQHYIPDSQDTKTSEPDGDKMEMSSHRGGSHKETYTNVAIDSSGDVINTQMMDKGLYKISK